MLQNEPQMKLWKMNGFPLELVVIGVVIAVTLGFAVSQVSRWRQLENEINLSIADYLQKFAGKAAEEFIWNVERYACKGQRPNTMGASKGFYLGSGNFKMALLTQLVGGVVDAVKNLSINGAVETKKGKSKEQIAFEAQIVGRFSERETAKTSAGFLGVLVVLEIGFLFVLAGQSGGTVETVGSPVEQYETSTPEKATEVVVEAEAQDPSLEIAKDQKEVESKGHELKPDREIVMVDEAQEKSLASNASPVPPGFMRLQNKDGRTIIVEFLALTKNSVLVKRDDGESFEIPLDNLSETSVQSIHEARKLRFPTR